VIESAGTVVDATVQKRWLRAIATLGLTTPWDTLDEPA
jgi:flagellar assembly protein FliH